MKGDIMPRTKKEVPLSEYEFDTSKYIYIPEFSTKNTRMDSAKSSRKKTASGVHAKRNNSKKI